MGRPRFHVSTEAIGNLVVTLSGPEAAHAEARRLRPNNEVELFDGRGAEAVAEVVSRTKGQISLRIKHRPGPKPPPPVRLVVGLGLLRWERLRLVLEKATELGVSEIWPLATDYSQPRAHARPEKMDRAVIESLKQCCRSMGPVVRPVQSLEEFIEKGPPGERLTLTRGGDPLPPWLTDQPPRLEVSLLVGPEGGLSREESALAGRAGFRPVGLSPAVLRAETATILAVGLIQSHWGEKAARWPSR